TGIKNPRATHLYHDEPATQQTTATPGDRKFHIVSKGETLYSIAWQYGQDVRDVAQWNHIRAPYTIYPNQKIRLKPPKLDKPVKRNPVIASNSRKNPPVKPVIKTKNSLKISWQWPTKGKIIGTYSARDSGKKGLDIAGKIGQRVYAAAGGQIVYSGSGLRGYGKLIIIKHNDTYFSAYAHNRRLFVKEEQQVKKGQHIADMGSSEADRAMLHFEVRRNGKPVDPLRYLPKRR
ncbi:MAG: peptidoglycan DD-metalloendopeptidase family protein, partial [Thioalkalispiraceae bacterium]